MTDSRRAIARTAIALMVVAVIIAALDILAVTNKTNPGSPNQSASQTSMPTTSTVCTQLESAPLFLIVRSSSTGSPISAVPVQVEKATPVNLCQPTSTLSTDLGTMETNVNGSVEVCCTGSTFYFRIVYQGANYELGSTAEGAMSAQCVTFYVPSGTTTTTYSGLLNQC